MSHRQMKSAAAGHVLSRTVNGWVITDLKQGQFIRLFKCKGRTWSAVVGGLHPHGRQFKVNLKKLGISYPTREEATKAALEILGFYVSDFYD